MSRSAAAELPRETAAAPACVADLAGYCRGLALAAKQAAAELASLPGETKNAWLRRSADLLRLSLAELERANRLDIDRAPEFGLTDAQIDRLRLDPARVESIARGLEEVAAQADPIGAVIGSTIRPNGMRVDRVRAPIGVVLFIYESRPNVTADAAAICVKAGSSVILRGGKEAAHSSRAIVDLMDVAAEETGLPAGAVQLVATADRSAVGELLGMGDTIDLAIPRGGEGLIRRVVAEATMPVLKHYDGNCHVYLDASADADLAESIVVNSKTHRYGVCNAAESLLVHADAAERLAPRVAAALAAAGVEIRADERFRRYVPAAKPATEADFQAEYLAPVISACVVDSLDDAIRHVNRYGSHHTDAIVTADLAAAERFAARVDSAAVMINASTRLNDGAEFGLGAEIGISTDKFHARGPCGVEELTTYKYVVHGTGQVRR